MSRAWRTGVGSSLSKKADIVVIDATAINVAPVHDPVAAVTLCADVSNVEHVIVDGEFLRDFKLLADVDRARAGRKRTRLPRRRRREGEGVG